MVQFSGGFFGSVRQAARSFAVDALPDATIITAGESPETAAAELEAHWYREASVSGSLDLPTVGDEVVGESEWREACRRAIADRIVEARAEVVS